MIGSLVDHPGVLPSMHDALGMVSGAKTGQERARQQSKIETVDLFRNNPGRC
jgi:hypothetical protein